LLVLTARLSIILNSGGFDPKFFIMYLYFVSHLSNSIFVGGELVCFRSGGMVIHASR
jgi:hypothetical protein